MWYNKCMKLKIDLHVHTNHSQCALIKPEEIEQTALKRGLHGVAITDHNTIDGAREVLSYAKTIKVIIAEEIKTSHGEIIGYFLQERIPPLLSPVETIREIKKQGGVVSIPHPFDRLRSSRIQRDALEEIIDKVDMIEIFNARDIIIDKDEHLIEKAVSNNAVKVVGSDAHLKNEVGRAYMIMDDFSSPQEFLNNLAAAQTVSRRSPVWVHLVTKFSKLLRSKQPGSKSPALGDGQKP